jgi:hypothetical protein
VNVVGKAQNTVFPRRQPNENRFWTALVRAPLARAEQRAIARTARSAPLGSTGRSRDRHCGYLAGSEEQKACAIV